MEILRYIRKNPQESDGFEGLESRHSWGFDWYMREDKTGKVKPRKGGKDEIGRDITGKDVIGIVPLPSTESECFCRGFLRTDESLVMHSYFPKAEESPNAPKIKLYFSEILQTNNPCAGIGINESPSGKENTKDLISLLTSQNPLHAYISTIDGRCRDVLTFSLYAPSSERYEKVNPMQIIEEVIDI